MMHADTVERYPLRRCGFFRLERKKDLARLLGVAETELLAIQLSKEQFTVRRTSEINGKLRALKYPRGKLRRLHERMRRLLARCQLPGYVYSPRRARSPITNALQHARSAVVEQLDIKQFYPSTTFKHVFDFFRCKLEMSADTAYILADLTTVDDALCFGSPVSPLVATLAHQDIFDPVAELAAERGFVFTVWVDDVTISGPHRPLEVFELLKRNIRNKGLSYHKARRFGGRRKGEVTGVLLKAHEAHAPARVHMKVRDLLRVARRNSDGIGREEAVERLIGLTHHQVTIAEAGGGSTERLERRLRWLRGLRRELARRPAANVPKTGSPATWRTSDETIEPF
jgi:hypothetical protein